MGRRRKYETAKAFEKAVKLYFSGISQIVPLKVDVLVGYTNSGKKKYKLEPITDDDGKMVMTYRYFKPPSVTGLCLHLGMSREALREYGEREGYGEAVRLAKLRIEDYLAEELMMRTSSVEGVKFNLSHNFGWSEKQRLEAAVDSGPVVVQFEGAAGEWAE